MRLAALALIAAVLAVGALAVASAAPMQPAPGYLAGDIVIEGGPAPGRVFHHEPGTVVVRNAAGKTVERRHVKSGHGYRFALRPGRYHVFAYADNIRGPHEERGRCQAQSPVTVRAAKTVRANAVCAVP